MSNERLIRKIAVIFVTDVVGFSTLMERNEALTLNSLRACRAILEDLFQEHSGRIFNTAGDSVLAEFQSAVSATICATEFQKLIQERNTSVAPEAKMHFRVGLNMGDVIVEGSNLYGEGVNVAARLEALSQAGGVCLKTSMIFSVKKSNFRLMILVPKKLKIPTYTLMTLLSKASPHEIQHPPNPLWTRPQTSPRRLRFCLL